MSEQLGQTGEPVSADRAKHSADVVIVGAGATGLAAGIFAARLMPGRSILLADGARRPGAKILVAGGGRCNVTNRCVIANDFNAASPHVVRRVLAALPVAATVAFFREIGVDLHEEEGGKLFPDTNRARTVLDALLAEVERCGVRLITGCRVTAIEPPMLSTAACDPAMAGAARAEARGSLASESGERMSGESGFTLMAGSMELRAGCVLMATGGKSLPKTGSDGGGYALVHRLGHSLVEPMPALVPLVLEGDFHCGLSGISHDVELTVHVAGRRPRRLRGAMLWTHFGVSGPVVLNASRHWHQARLDGLDVRLSVSFLPGNDFVVVEKLLLAVVADRPKVLLHNALAGWLPERFVHAALDRLGIEGRTPLAHLAREDRRRLVNGLLDWPLPVIDSRGFGHAEVTAGGVPLAEIDPATLMSRRCPGLFLAGEILDVDGRIGGFNFQWAWSSAYAASAGIARWFEGAGGAGYTRVKNGD